MTKVIMNEQLQQKIAKALEENQFCSFATIEGNKPHVRYMALFNDGMTIYLATNKKTHKVEELQSNPHVHLIAGFDGQRSSRILQIEATARISSDESLKEKIWRDDFKLWFDGKQDPNYLVIEISPSRIQYTDGEQPAEIWEK